MADKLPGDALLDKLESFKTRDQVAGNRAAGPDAAGLLPHEVRSAAAAACSVKEALDYISVHQDEPKYAGGISDAKVKERIGDCKESRGAGR